MAKLAELVHDQLSQQNYTHPLVGTATLELAPSTLHEQIQQFARVTVGAGCQQIQLLPLFLLPGVHVMEDIPAEVALAQANLGNAIALNLQPHLGANLGLGRLLAKQLSLLKTDAKILLAHGSRRIGGNEPIEIIANTLGMVAAYWSMQPTLEEQVKILADAGNQEIMIVPYFLFPGSITDAISQMVASLQEQFPLLLLRLGEPMGVSAELAQLVVDLIIEV
ncbi:MAG: sirohydrochlorin chelatase [Symploca sp. SIO2E6]|nr:sirohydrochlorin chelatase [Symploca sp. SIO2E6]